MKGYIVIKDGRRVNDVVMNTKGYIEMNIRKPFDKLECQTVGDSMNTVIFGVRTSQKRFNHLKNELERLNPEGYVFLQAKGL
jgi:hypothetical protein